MIISKTPLRMSFVGGGSDLPGFYSRHGGAVLSTAIDKYVYITVNQRFDHTFRISYSRTEEVSSVDEVQHPLARECLRLVGCTGGVEVTSIADIPARGTGLGSSSSFVVGMLRALHAYAGRYVSAGVLARQACEIEVERCGAPIGKQDQYAAAFGGLNVIRFHPDGAVDIEPVVCAPTAVAALQSQLLVFYTGGARSASAILAEQARNVETDATKQDALRRMVSLVGESRRALQAGDLLAFGEILHENWVLKSTLARDVSNAQIDEWYKQARTHGALGGKLLGAGGEGFLLVQAPVERHDAITAALSALRQVPFAFERSGSQIIFSH